MDWCQSEMSQRDLLETDTRDSPCVSVLELWIRRLRASCDWIAKREEEGEREAVRKVPYPASMADGMQSGNTTEIIEDAIEIE